MLAQSDLHAIRDTLKRMLEELRVDAVHAGQGARPVQLDQTAVGRLSRMDAMQQRAIAASNEGRINTEIRRVEAALNRIAIGAYGACCKCSETIAVQRLSADPATPFCLDCLEEIQSQ